MTFKKFTTEEKVRIFNKMLNHIKNATKYSEENVIEDDIYYACKVAGCQIFYDAILEGQD